MMKKKSPGASVPEGVQVIAESPQWFHKISVVAVATAMSLLSLDASALALGRVTVLSALGEPLRAEIDIPDINPDEAASLRAGVASPDAFKAAGLEYNPAMTGLQVSLQRRADGRQYLRLSSDRVVNDPFVDLILEANWASGRIVRDYTMLFDPPNLRQATPAPIAPQVSAAAAPAPAVAARREPTAPAPAAPAPAAAASKPAPAPKPEKPAPAAAPVRASAPATSESKVAVKPGETAGKIAATVKPANVSLDQMLVALLRANPDSFIDGNINRLKAGAVLDVPGSEQVASINAAEATQTVIAQSRDFNEFRRSLAEGAAPAKVASADRQAKGKVEAKVEDKKPASTAADKLTLSKGAAQGKAADDAVKNAQAKEAATRLAELSKNINDLNKLTGAAAASSAAKPASAAVAVPVATPASKPASTAVTLPAPVASAAKPAASVPAPVASAAASSNARPASVAAPAAASAPVPAPKPSAPKPAAKAPPPPPPEPTLVEQLLDNPLIPAGVAALIAALAGFGFYRLRQRKKSSHVDSSFLESRLQPDSFFGASGGQKIDTAEAASTGSSMVYSPSQLDAAGDVDPVAEADVYLAYGRDLQAEEILKEALRTNPSRVAIHAKLLEIYAKRRDVKAFEALATEAYGLTQGKGPEWEHICDLGRELDSANQLYQPGGEPAYTYVDSDVGALPNQGGASADFAATNVTKARADLVPPGSLDLDLDLDFSLDDEPAGETQQAASPASMLGTVPVNLADMPAAELPPEPQASAEPSLDLEFSTDLDLSAESGVEASPSLVASLDANEPTVSIQAPSVLEFDLDTPAPAPAPEPEPSRPTKVSPPSTLDGGMLEFDLDSISLDLGEPATQSAPPPEFNLSTENAGDEPVSEHGMESSDPLATKLALAEEFHAIGDSDGARSLVEEVLQEATGALKAKAERFLAELG